VRAAAAACARHGLVLTGAVFNAAYRALREAATPLLDR
jgi:hypothetical protein